MMQPFEIVGFTHKAQRFSVTVNLGVEPNSGFVYVISSNCADGKFNEIYEADFDGENERSQRIKSALEAVILQLND
jgi:hypothetical protein